MQTNSERAADGGADGKRLQQAEPIAIIGMAGRFPGSPDIDTFWEQLCAGTDAISEIPRDRYDVDAIFEPSPSSPGRTSSKWGGFLERIREFDAQFFGISPREAARMDPQQRLLLETTYEALEDAGQATERIAGSNTGVYMGQLGGDYWHMQYRKPEELEFYGLIGAAARAMTSGRVAYTFDFRGPSVTIDTACSSSLTAVHMAAQSIRSGETTMAVAGAANVVLLPEEGTVYSGARMLASDGRCKFGDASADGFVRSDGVGVVVLKSLAQARADGDRIRAVILGSAIGNDGQSSGYLVTPGVEGQRDVLLRAYEQAGVSPAEIDYLEAHGTGTSVGDKVELEVFGQVLGPGRPADRPCLVGSSKTNIGHAEAAAGMAGLIKTVLCLEHGEVPANLHQHTPNPDIPWADLPIRLPKTRTPLPDRGRPSMAGVSSFGLTGANAHVVLAAPDPEDLPAVKPRSEDSRAELLAVSAMSPEALATLATSYADLLENDEPGAPSLRDLCHSAGVRRSHYDSRLALPVTSRTEAAATLREFAEHGQAAGLASIDYVEEERPRVAFVFPGQGSQWIGMGRQLLDSEPVFRAAMQECDEVIADENGWSVIELLRGDDTDRFARVDVIQPTLWAMEIALAALWRSWGVEPDVVIGHSMGEAAAAYVSGALSLADAGAVICRRSRMARRCSGQGTMAWVELSAEEAAEAIKGHEAEVAIAAANSPTSTLLSGDQAALAEILGRLDERDVFNRWINVDYASHGPQMDAIRDDLLNELKHLTPRPGTIPLHSTLLNETIDGSQLDANYWARNIREPVDFVGAVRGELDAGETVFVEISPHAVLATAIDATAEDHGQPSLAVGSLRRDDDERTSLLNSLAKLYTAGVPFDWQAVTGPGDFVQLPRYPWQRVEHWIEDSDTPAGPTAAAAPIAPADEKPAETVEQAFSGHLHPLLGQEVPAAGDSRVWEGPVDLARNAYLDDHQVQGTIILPGTAYVELAAAAAQQVHGDTAVSVRDVNYHEAIFLGDEARIIRVTLRPEGDALGFQLHSRVEGTEAWTLHAEARVRPITAPDRGAVSIPGIRSRLPQHQGRAEFYPWHAARGNQWNGTFQAIEEVWRGDEEALARMSCPSAIRSTWEAHRFHPAVLDAAAHSLVAARADIVEGEDGAFVLGGISEVRIYSRPTTELWAHSTLRHEDRADSFTGDILVYDESGQLVAELLGLRLQYLMGKAPAPLVQEPVGMAAPMSYDDWLYEMRWTPTSTPRSEKEQAGQGTWIVLTDSGPAGRNVVKGLQAAGQHAVAVTAARGFSTTGTDRHRVDPNSRADLTKILLETAQGAAIRGVVHMWSLDAVASHDANTVEIQRAEDLACRSVVHLAQALDEVGHEEPPRLWLVSRGAQRALPGDDVKAPFQAPLWGLGRTIAIEHPDWQAGLVDLDDDPGSVTALVDHLLHGDEESQVALRKGRRLAARLVRKNLRTVAPTASGTSSLAGDDVAIRATHFGLSTRAAQGVPGGQPVSFDCVGVITEVGSDVRGFVPGDQVVAMAHATVSQTVITPAALVAPKPAHLSAAEAATLPHSFVTAYRALHELAALQTGQRLLVNDTIGDLGAAAEQIAGWLGVPTVDATTEDGGVDGYDAILTTERHPGTAVDPSRLRLGGRYLDCATAYGAEPASITARAFSGNRSFHVIDVPELVAQAPLQLSAALRKICDLAERRILQPLPYTEVGVGHAAKAEGTGKVVLVLPEQDFETAVPATKPTVVDVHDAATYLVTGGIGGIGGRVATWLVDRGARHLLLTGRSALPPVEEWDLLTPSDPRVGQIALLRALTRRGVEVEYAAVDAADIDSMRAVLEQRAAAGLPRVRGILHAAGTIEYTPVRELSSRQISSALNAKVSGAWALHRLAESEALDFFVLFSSGSSLLGSPLLGAYAAGNSFLDALALHRLERGQAATVVNWGFWDSVGMMARKAEEDGREAAPRGMNTFSPEEGLSVLERLLGSGCEQAAVLRVDWTSWAEAYPTLAATPQLRDLVRGGPQQKPIPRPSVDAPVERKVETRSERDTQVTRVMAPAPVATPVVTPTPAQVPSTDDGLEQELTGILADILKMPTSRITTSLSLKRMGMDSLMAVELRSRIDRRYQVNIPLATLLRGSTITKLATRIRSEAPNYQPQDAPAPKPDAEIASVPAPAAVEQDVVADKVVAPTPVVAKPTVTSAPAHTASSDDGLEQELTGILADILKMPTSRITTSLSLKRMGMDSLMAVELRSRIDRRYQVNIPLAKILRGSTITKLADHIRSEAPSTQDSRAAVEPTPAVVEPTPAPEPEPEAPAAVQKTPVAPTPPSTDDGLEQELTGILADILKMPTSRITTSLSLKRMGMDSLMAVELRSRIDRRYQVNIPLAKILRGSTITKLADHIRAES